jgi:hypothetical protein
MHINTSSTYKVKHINGGVTNVSGEMLKIILRDTPHTVAGFWEL